jgi:hypothetical protein
MSVVFKNVKIKRKSEIDSNIEIKNGLIGVNRDIFLLLIGFMNFYLGDNKTRNV